MASLGEAQPNDPDYSEWVPRFDPAGHALTPIGKPQPLWRGTDFDLHVTPLSSALCPLPSVLCPLSSVLCPLSSVLCPLSSALCPLPSALFPLPCCTYAVLPPIRYKSGLPNQQFYAINTPYWGRVRTSGGRPGSSKLEGSGSFMAGQISDTIEVAIVESDDQCRQFMSAVIGGTPGMRVTCTCATAREALWFFSQKAPDLFLADLFLRDMPGTVLVRRTQELWPSSSPILLIPNNHPRLVVEALEAGARAYLARPCAADELLCAVRTVHQGGAVLCSSIARAVVDYFRARGSVIHRLTDRESQVLTCLSRGLPQQTIAAELGIDRATVRTHVRNILGKLDVHSSAEAVALYLNPKNTAPAIEPVTSAPSSRLVRDRTPLLRLRTSPRLEAN